MIPQILNIGPLPVNSFGLMIALSLWASIYQLARSYRMNGIDPRLAEKYVLLGGFLGLAGARVWYLATHYDEVRGDLLGALVSGGGFVFYGGFIVGFAVLATLARMDKIPLHRFLDSVGPTLTVGYAIGRVGCQLSGDGDYGVATDGFWGMSYATGVVPTPPGVLVYPTPLFETAISVAILYVLVRAERSSAWRVPYRRFGLYLFCLSLERFFVEFLRINPRFDLFGSGLLLSQAQIIAIVLFLSGTVLMIVSAGRGARSREAPLST